VDYLVGEYRAATKYPNLHNVAIDSGPGSLSRDELHREAWSIASAAFAEARAESSERINEFLGRGKASIQLDEVLAAAHDGRIDRLFVACDREVWGTFDPASRRVSREDGPRVDNYDLLDDAARETFGHAGKVFVTPQSEVPHGGTVAAAFRW
jgi:hypothetical protein